MSGTIYYCSPTGNDASVTPTNIATPWRTWHYAFNNVTPGDTVYFRGGVYPAYSTSIGAWITDTDVDGTHDNPTCFFAYPADWAAGNYPIMDCDIMTNSVRNYGVQLSYCSNIYFKGLTVRNVDQISEAATGWRIWSESDPNSGGPNNIRFENCVSHNIAGVGFGAAAFDTVYFVNCDAYKNCDTLNTSDPGGHGNGFSVSARSDTWANSDESYAYFYGCRSWTNSDQGWGIATRATVILDNCWGIDNGNTPFPTNTTTKGSGIKLWYFSSTVKDITKTQLYIRNSIMAYNAYIGINYTDYNATAYPEVRGHIYNNFIYGNGYQVQYKGTPWGFGILDDDAHTDTTGGYDHWYWNNVSYNNLGYSAWSGANGDVISGIYNQSTNLFDVSTTPVTDNYFLSLDTAGMMGLHVRQADGSLPNIDFGKPVVGSPLIDAGTDVGLPFVGDAPDIGWFESGEIDETATDILTFNISEQTGAATINSTNHTVSIEVDYTANVTDLTPTITLSYGATILPLSGVARDFTNPVPYTVTAEDGVTYQEWTVTVTQAEEPEDPPAEGTQKMVKFGTAIIRL